VRPEPLSSNEHTPVESIGHTQEALFSPPARAAGAAPLLVAPTPTQKDGNRHLTSPAPERFAERPLSPQAVDQTTFNMNGVALADFAENPTP
jgi:hypothetical protein